MFLAMSSAGLTTASYRSTGVDTLDEPITKTIVSEVLSDLNDLSNLCCIRGAICCQFTLNWFKSSIHQEEVLNVKS